MSNKGPAPYTNSYLAGIGLGLVLLASFVVMGRGLGASGAMTRMALYSVHKVDAAVHGGTTAEQGTVAGTNKYMAKYIKADRDPLNEFLVFMFLGLVVGGLLSGAFARRVSFQIIMGPNTTATRRLIFALLGGLVSAFGARLARGCTSGQALTGGATLALGSWVFMMAVFAGGYALAYFMRKEWT
jgi:uncharacterized membrane protein YedE/YeeE